MSRIPFRAIIVTELPDRSYVRSIALRNNDELPAGDVLIRVHYSSLNYKDALSATGNKGVTRHYPHTPGIDAAGLVEVSSSSEFSPGDQVVVTGNDLGSNTDGGFAEYIRVPAQWVVKIPKGLSLAGSMMLGTAGYTAALSIHRLQALGITPEAGPVLVTGATGGVGSIAVMILSKLGYRVLASSGKQDATSFLKTIGASEILTRDDVKEKTGKGLLPGRWAGVVDTVGGEILDGAIRATKLEGAVASCGNVTSGELRSSIYPFILRGVSLLGINSAFTPLGVRQMLWQKLANEWFLPNIGSVVTEVTLDGVDKYIDLLLQGAVRGRVLIRVKD
jgi:acrylyl-CoA reductase (NADPH)